jgi:REP element-mobilizing transposase RayT
MIRGIEGRAIVSDDEDRAFFVFRMGKVAQDTRTIIYAWSLMTNHAHILLRSGASGLPKFMSRLLTGYASGYNRRYQRHGHLFQNRYKSIVCEEEPYFIRLVSYIHLNPLRAGMVRTLQDLEDYTWCGHAALLGKGCRSWQDRDYVLACFGDRPASALDNYREHIETMSGLGRQPELIGGGLIRSKGGWSDVKSMRQRGKKQFCDARILGGGEFVQDMLQDAADAVRERLPAIPVDAEARDRVREVCEEAGVSVDALLGGCRMRVVSDLRKRLVVEFVREKGMSYASAARYLGVSEMAVYQIVQRLVL